MRTFPKPAPSPELGDVFRISPAVQNLGTEISECKKVFSERFPHVACEGEVPGTVTEVGHKISRCLDCLEHVLNSRGRRAIPTLNDYELTERIDVVLATSNQALRETLPKQP